MSVVLSGGQDEVLLIRRLVDSQTVRNSVDSPLLDWPGIVVWWVDIQVITGEKPIDVMIKITIFKVYINASYFNTVFVSLVHKNVDTVGKGNRKNIG